jgi:bifunctional non-homologous end joining protein LigD
MLNVAFPSAAVPAEIRRALRLQIVSRSATPPEGDGWLHEIKHDGHRPLAIISSGDLKLISRNGHDRTRLFGEPFAALAGLPPLVLDGEIAVPDEEGVTHIDALSEALAKHQPERLACFAFDLLHLDGHVLKSSGCPRGRARCRLCADVLARLRLRPTRHVAAHTKFDTFASSLATQAELVARNA